MSLIARRALYNGLLLGKKFDEEKTPPVILDDNIFDKWVVGLLSEDSDQRAVDEVYMYLEKFLGSYSSKELKKKMNEYFNIYDLDVREKPIYNGFEIEKVRKELLPILEEANRRIAERKGQSNATMAIETSSGNNPVGSTDKGSVPIVATNLVLSDDEGSTEESSSQKANSEETSEVLPSKGQIHLELDEDDLLDEDDSRGGRKTKRNKSKRKTKRNKSKRKTKRNKSKRKTKRNKSKRTRK